MNCAYNKCLFHLAEKLEVLGNNLGITDYDRWNSITFPKLFFTIITFHIT
jgi:hypothetical protein